MKIKPFGVEMYMNEHEDFCKYNLGETCVSSLTVDELLDLVGNKEEILQEMLSLRLSYGHIKGSLNFKAAVCSLYKTVKPENVLSTHGAIGANHLTITTLVEPGDEVISVLPTYQQLYSIPESLGAKVHILPLNMENKFLPDLDLLKKTMNNKVKLVCINNPNNPSGAVMDEAFLKQIIEIVKPYGSYILCDEVYRGLIHEGDNMMASMADLYEKGISTGSMSKTYSLAGLRLGWIAAPEDVIEKIFIHRDYNTISCGVLDDYLAALALKNKDKVFERSLKILKNNLTILDNWVNNDPNFNYVKPKAGTTAFVKLNFDIPSEEFCLGILKEKGVLIVPGKAMDMEGFIRIGYAYEAKLLQTGLDMISEYARKLLG